MTIKQLFESAKVILETFVLSLLKHLYRFA